tara:strand:+ start:44 stop:625 length:582 start_codon:yes stop_codon:yes gene_type:complete
MKIEYFFPTLIYIKKLPNAEKLNQYLEPRIIKWSQQNKGVAKTNAGGWHSETNMNKREEYNPLTIELFNMQEEIYKKENLSRKPVMGNMWANINGPGNYNRPHVHPNSLFSGVYWIKTPENSGNLMLYDPRPGTHMSMPNRTDGKLPPELWREVQYSPKAGTCIMFPSWLWHEVKPNQSSDTRISVSFNFLQR